MTPYYEHNGITIYHGNCLELMPAFAADLIIADPLYVQTAHPWDRWPKGWPSIARESLTPNGSMWVFGTLRMFWDMKKEFDAWRPLQDIIWEKQNGTSLHKDRFRRVHEQVVQFIPKKAKWGAVTHQPVYTHDATRKTIRRKARPSHWGAVGTGTYVSVDGGPRLMRSVIYAQSAHGRALNETQKPLDIVNPIERYSCPPGGLVLSPFMGSGTDLLAAATLGLRAIGIDIREDQCEKAARRLSQIELFEVVA